MATKTTLNKKGAKHPPKTTSRNKGKPWQEVFLEELAKGGNVTRSARKAGVDRTWVYKYREEDRAFAEKWESALAESADELEAAAWERVMVGDEVPVFFEGSQVGSKFVKSDALHIFLLKGAKPEKYRERHEHSGPDGGAIPVALNDLIDKSYGDDSDNKPELDKAD